METKIKKFREIKRFIVDNFSVKDIPFMDMYDNAFEGISMIGMRKIDKSKIPSDIPRINSIILEEDTVLYMCHHDDVWCEVFIPHVWAYDRDEGWYGETYPAFTSPGDDEYELKESSVWERVPYTTD